MNIILQIGTKLWGWPPEQCVKFHDDSYNTYEDTTKRDFKLTSGKFLAIPTPGLSRGKWDTD